MPLDIHRKFGGWRPIMKGLGKSPISFFKENLKIEPIWPLFKSSMKSSRKRYFEYYALQGGFSYFAPYLVI